MEQKWVEDLTSRSVASGAERIRTRPPSHMRRYEWYEADYDYRGHNMLAMLGSGAR